MPKQGISSDHSGFATGELDNLEDLQTSFSGSVLCYFVIPSSGTFSDQEKKKGFLCASDDDTWPNIQIRLPSGNHLPLKITLFGPAARYFPPVYKYIKLYQRHYFLP